MRLPLKTSVPSCSFCGKKESPGTRLVGGPTARICDACIGVCNNIFDATPSHFAGWDAMSDAQLLGSLKSAVTAVEATRTVLQAQIDALKKRGVSWNAIGGALGISRQAAWERFS